MTRSEMLGFAAFALLVAVVVPYLAFNKSGHPDTSPARVPEHAQEGKELFGANCGSCHTLTKAGTKGVVAPDLDDLPKHVVNA